MVELDLSEATQVLFGSNEALAVRIANTDIWTKPSLGGISIPTTADDVSTKTLALADGAGVGTLTIPKPINTAAGDLLVAAVAARYNTSVDTPSGWTKLNEVVATYGPLAIFSRLVTDPADVSDPSFTIATGVSSRALGVMARIPSGATLTPLETKSISSSVQTPSEVETFSAHQMGEFDIDLIALASFTQAEFGNGSSVSPAGYSPVVQIFLPNSNRAYLGIMAKQDAAGQNLAPSVTWVASTINGGASTPSGGELRFVATPI